jgi:hypothetical protein
MKCIFDEYFEEGKECERGLQCDGCDVHTNIKCIVEIILSNTAQSIVDTEVKEAE